MDEEWPRWLRPLLQTSFFGQCKVHAAAHKSECNMFCLDCVNGPLCSLCLNIHKDHPCIQIRRSSYHDVIRVGEIQKYVDITGVQTYIINSAKIVFLNHRPQPRPGKGVTNTCLVCHRSLLDSFSFCSLGCKIAGKSKIGEEEERMMMNGQWHNQVIGNRMMHSFSPSTPPRTPMMNYRNAKRRKGTPHRAPTGALTMEC
ncbi:hypothetical protein ACS0TY_028725 [Phlomoides rotata]